MPRIFPGGSSYPQVRGITREGRRRACAAPWRSKLLKPLVYPITHKPLQVLVEERESPRLDAFARRRAGGRAGIVEGAVRGEARRPARVRVEHLEHQRLVALHAGE